MCDRKIGPFDHLAARFWSKVNTDGKCWEWGAGRGSHGYGIIMYRGADGRHALLAHRVAYEMELEIFPRACTLTTSATIAVASIPIT